MTIDVGLFLELIQQYSYLYDKSSKYFKDLASNIRPLSSISKFYCIFAVEEIQTRWRTLRERFSKEIKIATGKSGASTDECISQWEWFSNMQFLTPHIKPRKTSESKLAASRSAEENEGNVSINDLEFISMEHSSQVNLIEQQDEDTSSSTRSIENTNKRKRAANTNVSSNIDMEILRTLREIDSKREDEDDTFGKAIASELRKISDPEEKKNGRQKYFLLR
ncbi:hypothetical protein FQR65_LT18994 [Abscondita terminalis]|nr:hypothetical protein FQR65_LT18994 [Abscondita terminalis]